MKRSILLLATMMIFVGAYAQKYEIQNASDFSRNNDLDRAITAIEKATTNAETIEDCKAWYLKGYILLQLDNMYSMVRLGEPGLTESELNKAFAPYNTMLANMPLKPESKKSVKQEDGSKHKVATYLYEIKATFGADGKLLSITEPTGGKYIEQYGNLLDAAISAFDRSIEIGTEEDYVLQSKQNLTVAIQRYFNLAAEQYQAKNYVKASEYFEKCNTLNLKYFNTTDEEAMKYSNSAIRMYVQEALNAHDTTAILNGCALGQQKFPEDVDFVMIETPIWLAKKNNDKVVETIEKTLSMVKDNPMVFYNAGVYYMEIGRTDDAIINYNKAIELKPDYFDAYYNLASIYIDNGNKILTEANNLPLEETEKYNELKQQSFDVYSNAVIYLEKAHELNTQDIYVLRALKDIYTRLQKVEDIKRVNELINELETE
ncbi:MAG: tetratricopeptide repeat protein [Bacteroidales bacterium]|jgi:tetratricopeptide (TPR) repeat protein|nr:tetratricopeptide repeat protein [Bacteroidales bacterium]MDD2204935.1 tetratricopeptide repeat protein [Bacteroidales bacterium]MDD3914558.1 tetratricopeptide repeat protein [Bacteroidales bacterium]MDD4634452.1 tetratricopeptide repeat protein [Bacteroidales bacterium]